jgi:hypothetical protein
MGTGPLIRKGQFGFVCWDTDHRTASEKRGLDKLVANQAEHRLLLPSRLEKILSSVLDGATQPAVGFRFAMARRSV